MHIIISLHSLPGGVNGLDIGEALLHNGWFNNQANLDYSYRAIDAILAFIQASGRLDAWTIAPINEASDVLASIGTSLGLSLGASVYVSQYIRGVLDRIAAVDRRIPLMLQDSFKGGLFWVSKNLICERNKKPRLT